MLVPLISSNMMHFVDTLHRLDEETVRFYVAQLIICFQQLDAGAKIFHHDPNLYNLLLTSDGRLQIIDFGHAKSPFWNSNSNSYEKTDHLNEEQMQAVVDSRLVNWLYLGNIICHMLTGWREDTAETWPQTVYESFKSNTIIYPSMIQSD